MSHVRKLNKMKLITPPYHVPEGLQYEVIMGSVAYGSSDDTSDMDIYGFSIPPKEIVFPHLKGEIQGFGSPTYRFNQYEEHHIQRPDNKKEYDIVIYNIVKYFQLCMNNNPNMIDSLFVPQRCILYCSRIGDMVRGKRRMFLHRGSFHRFKGYSFSNLHKMKIKKPEGKRKELIEKYGFDVKFASNVVRLLNEVEQILIEHDLDLERNREQLKSIRRGEWTIEQIEDYFDRKQRSLEDLYTKSTLQYKPDENAIKELLLNCLEEYYGNIDKFVKTEEDSKLIIHDLKELIQKYDK